MENFDSKVSKQNASAEVEIVTPGEKLSGKQKFVRGLKKTLWAVGCIIFVPFRAALETAIYPLKQLCPDRDELHSIKFISKSSELPGVMKALLFIWLVLRYTIGFCLRTLLSPLAYLKSAIENAVTWGKAIGTDDKVITCDKYLTGKNDIKKEKFSFRSFIKFIFGVTTTNVTNIDDLQPTLESASVSNSVKIFAMLKTFGPGNCPFAHEKEGDIVMNRLLCIKDKDLVDFRPPVEGIANIPDRSLNNSL